MRGKLDDTLARMARREELQRRRAAHLAAQTRSASDEVIDAVRRVVAQHPELTVTLRVTHGAEEGTPLRVAWSEGETVVFPATAPAAPTTTADAPATTPDAPAVLTTTPEEPVATPEVPVATAPDVPVAAAPPAWPLSVKTVPAWAAATDSTADDSAARLANLIRRNPSLLTGSTDDEN